MFCDLHVHTRETGGENTLEEMIKRAKKLGIECLGICRFDENPKWTDIESEIDLVKVVIIKDSEDVNKKIDRVREKAEIVAIQGGDYDVNREACENSKVDILLNPEFGRKDSGLDHICVREAAENQVAIEINFHQILTSYGKRRAYLLKSMQKNIKLCEKYKANIITSSGAQNIWDMRTCREMASFPFLLGLELGKAIETTSNIPSSMVEENREKLKGNKWKGVAIDG